MTRLQTLLVKPGPAAVKAVLKIWFNDRDIAADISSSRTFTCTHGFPSRDRIALVRVDDSDLVAVPCHSSTVSRRTRPCASRRAYDPSSVTLRSPSPEGHSSCR